MASSEFDQLADEREEFAQSISDLEIARHVVQQVLQLSEGDEMKVSILMDAIPDIGTIFANLKFFNREGQLSNRDFHDMLEVCLIKYHERKGIVDFNPLTYNQKLE